VERVNEERHALDVEHCVGARYFGFEQAPHRLGGRDGAAARRGGGDGGRGRKDPPRPTHRCTRQKKKK
jgi:hypothetical protein